MFTPPRCTHRHCRYHTHPKPKFFRRHGTYRARCRSHPVPRFLCTGCRRTFSRQTFRADYRDHRPSLNVRLFKLLASGMGLRQSSRLLGLSRRCTELKARKIGRHLRRLNLNLRSQLPRGSSLQFDELETYEGRRNTRPLTVPMLIEKDSRFVVCRRVRADPTPRSTMTRATPPGHRSRRATLRKPQEETSRGRQYPAGPCAAGARPGSKGLTRVVLL